MTNTIEQIETIRNMNIIEDTTVDYNQSERNSKLLDSIGRVNVMDLTSEQAKGLGFGLWDEETNLHLIPFFLYDFLEYGQTFTSIGGDDRIVTPGYQDTNSGSYIDNDHRFGCLAYGFVPKD